MVIVNLAQDSPVGVPLKGTGLFTMVMDSRELLRAGCRLKPQEVWGMRSNHQTAAHPALHQLTVTSVQA